MAANRAISLFMRNPAGDPDLKPAPSLVEGAPGPSTLGTGDDHQ